ncbi:hypothetical protein J437_LFUL015369 [Ladona fulva]|uniref:Uncharacterized protein n=1 Tax=Ladona fulva TaxID=123851 RepID=A0A8K0JV01_LADFU|nr:hypothetical protein J437_LFUL015369 [Ladona fulva]
MDEDEVDRGIVLGRMKAKDLILAEEGRSDSAICFQFDPPENESSPGTTIRRNKVRHDPILNKALMKAVSTDDEQGVETALLCGADVDAQGPPFFISALQFAAWLGSKKMVEFLLSNGASPNSSDIYGRTPLHLAAAMDFKECVYLLLEGGADANAYTKEIEPSQLVPIGLANSIMASAKTRISGNFRRSDNPLRLR